MPFTPVTFKSLIRSAYDFEPKTVGEHIRKKRLQLGITQKEAATRLGVTDNTVFNWEVGLKAPSFEYIPALIKFLGYDPEPPNPTTLPEQLVAKRRELGWTQKAAAKKLGVDPCTWSTWECGGQILFVEHRRLVARFLELPEATIHTTMRKRWGDSHRVQNLAVQSPNRMPKG